MMEQILKNNTALKILLFMALLFWAYVTGDNLHDSVQVQEITRTYLIARSLAEFKSGVSPGRNAGKVQVVHKWSFRRPE